MPSALKVTKQVKEQNLRVEINHSLKNMIMLLISNGKPL